MKDLNLEQVNTELEGKPAQEIMAWAIQTFSPKAALTSSFGAQATVLIHMATKVDPKVPVIFIDTGFLFKETYAFVDELEKSFKLNLKRISPDPADIAEVKERLAKNDIRCCDDIKVKGMKKAMEDLECWIAGLRRGQAETRKNIKIVEEYQEGLIKIHPIASWSSKQVYEYMKENDLPFHPLWEKGYTSIGCEPCTRPPMVEGDERSGRWADKAKTECGLHTFLEKKD